MPQMREDPKESKAWEEEKEPISLRCSTEDEELTLKWEADKEDHEPDNQHDKDSPTDDRTSHGG